MASASHDTPGADSGTITPRTAHTGHGTTQPASRPQPGGPGVSSTSDGDQMKAWRSEGFSIHGSSGVSPHQGSEGGTAAVRPSGAGADARRADSAPHGAGRPAGATDLRIPHAGSGDADSKPVVSPSGQARVPFGSARASSAQSSAGRGKKPPPPPPPRHPGQRNSLTATSDDGPGDRQNGWGEMGGGEREGDYPSPTDPRSWAAAGWTQAPVTHGGRFDIGFAPGAFGGAPAPDHPVFAPASRSESEDDEHLIIDDEDDGASGEIESVEDALRADESVATSVLERRGLDKRRHCHRRRLSDGALSAVEHEAEVIHVDYTPVTARRPIDSRAALRPLSMGRTIKLFITITAYNEGGKELHQTLQAVAKNMEHIQELCGISWKEVLILVVQDGRAKMAKTMEVFLRKNRLWDRRMLLAEHEGMPVTCHVFERTVNLVKSRTTREYYPSMQVVFAAKEKNGGKLNSHLWAFSAFARQFQPEFLLLLDVGTMPREFAIARMIKAMQVNPQVAGVCGEIAVHKPNYGSFVQAAQAFEYAIQHVLDKSFESICGFIGVLPGAFSAYRWKAMRGEPLNQYFLLEEIPFREIDPAIANMYLAEDRVLCYELVAKRRRNYTLHYVNDAVAETDIPTTIVDLIKQRRRWLNGTFFALIYVLLGFPRLLSRSDHSIWRQIALTFQFIFNFGGMLISWFGIGSLFLSFFLIYKLAFEQVGPEAGSAIMWAFSSSFMIIVLAQLLLALGNKPQEVARVYYVLAVGMGVIMYFSIVLSAWHLGQGDLPLIVLIAASATFVVYGVCSAVHWRLDVICLSIAQYLFMLPTFVTSFAIYSFSNLHDISWGTREGGLRRQEVEEVQAAPEKENRRLYDEDDNVSGDWDGSEHSSDDEEEARARLAAAVQPGYYQQGYPQAYPQTYPQSYPQGAWAVPGQGQFMPGYPQQQPQASFAAGYGAAEARPAEPAPPSGAAGDPTQDSKAAFTGGGAPLPGGGTAPAVGARMSQAGGVGVDSVDMMVPPTPVADGPGVVSRPVLDMGSGSYESSEGEEKVKVQGGVTEITFRDDDHDGEADTDSEVEELAEQAVAEAARRAEAERMQTDNDRRMRIYEKEKEELRMKFIGFRTRIMVLWMFCNWVAVTALLNWQRINEFAYVVAYLAFFSLSYRAFGSVWYMLEKYFKRCWGAFCSPWCCIRCCWEVHRSAKYDNNEEMVGRKRAVVEGYENDDDDQSWISDGSVERRAEERWGRWSDLGDDMNDSIDGDAESADDAMAPEAKTAIFSAEATDGAAGALAGAGDDDGDDGSVVDLGDQLREAEAATSSALARIEALDGKPTKGYDSSADLERELREAEAATSTAISKVDALRGKRAKARADDGDDMEDLSALIADGNSAVGSAIARVDALGRGAGSSHGLKAGSGSVRASGDRLSTRGSAEAWPETPTGAVRGAATTTTESGRVVVVTTTTTTTTRHDQSESSSTWQHVAPAGVAESPSDLTSGLGLGAREAEPGPPIDEGDDEDDEDDDDEDEDEDLVDLSAMLREANAATSSAIDSVDRLRNSSTPASRVTGVDARRTARRSDGSDHSSGTLDPSAAVAAALSHGEQDDA